MDIQRIATAAMALLSPYLTKAGEVLAKEAGEELVEKASALHQAIKAKFKGDAYAEQTLARLEEKPKAKGRQAALREVLAEKLEEDPNFAQVVRRLLKEAKAADTRNVIAFGERSVAVGGDVSGSTIITGDGNIIGDDSLSHVMKIDDRSGGVYFGGARPPHIQGDVVGGNQIKTTHETHFHSPVTGPVHTGSGYIRIGEMQVAAKAPLETLLVTLRQAVVAQAPPAVRSKALQRVDWLAEAITEGEPDLGLMESVLKWFQKYLPFLVNAVAAIIHSPAMRQTIETAGEPTVAEFQRRFSR